MNARGALAKKERLKMTSTKSTELIELAAIIAAPNEGNGPVDDPPAVEHQEPVEQDMMQAKAKAKPPSKRKKGVTTARRSLTGDRPPLRPGSKLQIVAKLLKRKEGCTAQDVMKACNWPSVSMPQQAKMLKIKLRTEMEGRTKRYWEAD